MFRKSHLGRIHRGIQFFRRSATTHRSLTGLLPYRRRLQIEPLEDRRLLSITVNTLIDVNNAGDGLTTLREAIAAAAANDTINFSVTGTINLTSLGQLTINKNLTITGPGANLLTIQAYNPSPAAGNGSRVFNVDDGSSSSTKTVSISGLTLAGGDASGNGGAIRNLENLTVTNSTISGNAATGNGGGIYSANHNLVVTGSTVSGNTAKYGGGIYCVKGTLIVTGSTISGNSATSADGGGIYSEKCPVTVSSSTISGNSAAGDGGGIFADATTVTVTSSTINGNTADAGGGISNGYGTLNVTNSTISGNQAKSDGGGIYVDHGDVTVTHTTITANRADSDNNGNGLGGGIIDVGTGTEAYRHTIIASNTRGASTRSDASGPIELQYSLIGDSTGATINNQGGNQIGTAAAPINPLLGPLANNSGPTMTHALLAGSPAIDAGNASAVAGAGGVPLYDQRGTPYTRVYNGDAVPGARIDIGAFEWEPVGPALPADYNQNNVVDAADFVLWRKTLGTTGVPAYSGADGDGDGMVDQDDYGVWRAHFGQTVGAGSGVSGEGASGGVGGVSSGAGAAFFAEGQGVQSAQQPSALLGVDAAFDARGRETGAQLVPTVAAFGTAGPASRDARSMGPHASLLLRGAIERRDDALVAWLNSRTAGRVGKTVETRADMHDEKGGGAAEEAFSTIDTAFDAIEAL